MSEWVRDKAIAVVSVVVLLLIASLVLNGVINLLDWIDGDTVTSGNDVVRDLVETERLERE